MSANASPFPFTFQPRKPFTRRVRPAEAVTAAPALVQATYQSAVPSIRLTFDRAVNVPALAGNQIVIADGSINALRYDAQGDVTLINPTTIEIGLTDIEAYAGPDVRMTASAASGIVAVDGGAAWGGVTNLLLPFP
jgi:hypothetical protein